MGKLMQLKVLIIGMRGSGVETAKNLVLAGPKSLDIFDDAPVALPDLGNNFYLGEKDVGRRRDEATLDQLADLNKYVKVQRLESLEGVDFAAYNIVVACDQPQDKC
ncbi:UBA1, partial [Symbiodinium sp. KB8]